MTLQEAEEIEGLLIDEGHDAKVYPDYSGRGMCGKTCVGIVTDQPELVGFFAAQIGMEKPPTRRDSMGRKTIVY